MKCFYCFRFFLLGLVSFGLVSCVAATPRQQPLDNKGRAYLDHVFKKAQLPRQDASHPGWETPEGRGALQVVEELYAFLTDFHRDHEASVVVSDAAQGFFNGLFFIESQWEQMRPKLGVFGSMKLAQALVDDFFHFLLVEETLFEGCAALDIKPSRPVSAGFLTLLLGTWKCIENKARRNPGFGLKRRVGTLSLRHLGEQGSLFFYYLKQYCVDPEEPVSPKVLDLSGCRDAAQVAAFAKALFGSNSKLEALNLDTTQLSKEDVILVLQGLADSELEAFERLSLRDNPGLTLASIEDLWEDPASRLQELWLDEDDEVDALSEELAHRLPLALFFDKRLEGKLQELSLQKACFERLALMGPLGVKYSFPRACHFEFRQRCSRDKF